MIELYCSCGRCIKLPEKYLGRAAACPGCRRRIRGVSGDIKPEADQPGDGPSTGGAFDWALIIQSGPRQVGEQIVLGGAKTLAIGKSDECDIRLRDEGVSREHCRLVRSGYGWRIEDSDSKNGVLVNGRQAKASNLRAGDVLRIGGFDLRYIEALGPPPVVTPTQGPIDNTKSHQTAAKRDESKSGGDDELTLIEEEVMMSMSSTATAAIPLPMSRSSDDDSIGLANDDLDGAPPPLRQPTNGKCPECGAKVPEHARLCIGCGFNFATGRRIAGADEAFRAAAADAKAKARAALTGEFGGFVSSSAAAAAFVTDPGSLVTFLMVALLQILATVVQMVPFGNYLTFGAWFILQGWVCAYLFSVIEHSAAGRTDLPEMSLTDGFFDGVVAPFFKFMFACAICFVPSIVYLIVRDIEFQQAIQNRDSAVAILMALGVFFWPIVMLILAIGGIGCLLRLDLILATIMRSIIAYIMVFVLLAVVILMSFTLARMLTAKGPTTTGGAVAVALLLQLIQLYATVVTMQVIGLYYHHFKARFAWSWG